MASDHHESHAEPASAVAGPVLHHFDARGVARRFRHAAIFAALDVLTPGEAMRFVNDHDPLPLIRQIQTVYEDAVTVDYLQRSAESVTIIFAKVDA